MSFSSLKALPSFTGEMKWGLKAQLLFFVLIKFVTFLIYGCLLTSSVSVRPKIAPLNSVEDIARAVREKGYAVETIKGASYAELMKTSRNSHIETLERDMASRGYRGVKNYKEGLTRVLGEKLALIGGREYIKSEIFLHHFPIERFHIAREGFFPDNSIIAFNALFPCKAAFNNCLLQVICSGLWSKWHSDKQFARRMKSRHSTSFPGTLLINTHDFKSLMWFMGGAGLLSLFVLFGEIISRISRRKIGASLKSKF